MAQPGEILAGLIRRGVPAHVAQGVLMNFRDESGYNTGIQERAPTAGRGGYGLAQWTGPRRVALEQFAKGQGKPADDLDVQLDYFMSENQGPEARAWKQVLAAPNANQAAVSFLNNWERPAAGNAERRAARYAQAGPLAAPGTGLAPTVQPAQEANPMTSYMRGIMGIAQGGGSDWMSNTSYSADALLGDVLAGHSPLRRLMYQKVMGLFG